MPADRTFFVTGAAGFMGSEMVRELARSYKDCRIYALVRGKAGRRIDNAVTIGGDITKANLGMSKKEFDNLTAEVDTIYHFAAITDLNTGIKELRRVNADGTKNVLDFALSCKEKGRLRKANHISTSYVAGTLCAKKLKVMEDDLDTERTFNNGYEETKREAEMVVARYRQKGLDVDIFRPSIVLGRYSDGMTTKFKMMYQPIHFFSLELFERIPRPAHNAGNMINLDIAVRAICRISDLSGRPNTNYHITSPSTVALEYLLKLASGYFGFRMPQIVGAEDFDIDKELTPVKRKMLEPYMPYFDCAASFDMTNTNSALEGAGFSFPGFDEDNFFRLFKYCDETGFIRRKKHAVIG